MMRRLVICRALIVSIIGIVGLYSTNERLTSIYVQFASQCKLHKNEMMQQQPLSQVLISYLIQLAVER